MPSGKYKGAALSALALDYLRWLLSLDDLRELLKGAVIAELLARHHAVQLPLLPCPDLRSPYGSSAPGAACSPKKLHPGYRREPSRLSPARGGHRVAGERGGECVVISICLVVISMVRMIQLHLEGR